MGGRLPVEEKQLDLAERRESLRKNTHALTDSVSFRVMGLFVLVIFIVIMVFELFYYHVTKNSYYDNVVATLSTQASYNSELYLTYLSNEDLNSVVVENKNQFYRSTPCQVQILSNSGLVIYDSLASQDLGRTLRSSDVLEAKENKVGHLVYRPAYTDEQVLSLSQPLWSQTNQVGILRLTTSLNEVNGQINQRLAVSLLFSFFALLVGVGISYFVSSSILREITDLTKVANKLADGQLGVRANEHNMGEIGDLARTMNIMSDNLQEKDQIKNDFISSVSHELRTPMTSIKGWAITLQTPGITEEIQKEGLKIIEKESERLSAMVEDLLDFSRFSSGRLKLTKREMDVVEVMNHLITQIRPRTREKEIDVVYHYSENSIVIVADDNRIKQMLLNILDNAIKFTPNGGVIFCEIEKEEDQVQISITDTGIGIPKEEIKLVTERFWKGSSSMSHSGLGLSICEEIAKAHGGSLSIRSQVDVGTKVIMTLPIQQV